MGTVADSVGTQALCFEWDVSVGLHVVQGFMFPNIPEIRDEGMSE
jgi:hypothetical protein